MGDTAEHIRDQLALIVKRRNQIAHESDIDPSTSMLRNIDLQTVNDCRDFYSAWFLLLTHLFNQKGLDCDTNFIFAML